MISRNVSIQGVIYDTHDIQTIEHNYTADKTFIGVLSHSTNNGGSEVTSWYDFDLDESLTKTSAEELMLTHDNFQEAVDVDTAVSNAVDNVLVDILPLLDDEQAERVKNLFKPWAVDKLYEIGDRVLYNHILWKCVQQHTSQEDWTPDAAASLWSRTGQNPEDPNGIPTWIQPTGAQDAYQTGDKVIHNNTVYISTVDNNTWEPGVYFGWDVVSDESDENDISSDPEPIIDPTDPTDPEPTTEPTEPVDEPSNYIYAWVQPTGAQDAYQTGDEVTHNGYVWVSTSDNNVWEPGVYGWEQE